MDNVDNSLQTSTHCLRNCNVEVVKNTYLINTTKKAMEAKQYYKYKTPEKLISEIISTFHYNFLKLFIMKICATLVKSSHER